eukprot:12911669-Prorocentrum_lima.AAC.1
MPVGDNHTMFRNWPDNTEWAVEWNGESDYTFAVWEENTQRLAADCDGQLLIEEYRSMCEAVVNIGVDNMYVMCNDLLSYDMNN